jgi:exonuclease SbcC
MRPLKLTMTAFGPYRDRETIDFTELEDRRLFVISGMTGAGKTTIFDAISYALYGSASGEDRADHRMLRSHFADEETHTSVDLHFAVGSRSYRVFRQMGHRKGNNKNETGGKIELYETTSGVEVPCVDRFTVSDVNAKLEAIIGLTKEQFSQIVMLPQGEFRKLLTSDTENKEEILRRIFRTSMFQRLEDRFYEQSRQLKDAHREAAAKLEIHMQHAAETLPKREDSVLMLTFLQEHYSPAQVLQGLTAEADYYAGLAQTADEKREQASGKLAKLEEEKRAADELNRLIAELSAQRSRLEELKQQKEAMDEIELRLQTAEHAARLEPYEEHARITATDAEAVRAQLEAKRREAAIAVQQHEAAVAQYRQEEGRADERHRTEMELNRLQELLPAVRNLGELQLAVNQLQTRQATLEEQQTALDKQLQDKRKEKQELIELRNRLEEAARKLPERLSELDRLRQKARLLQELVQLDQQLAKFNELEAVRRQTLSRIRQEHDRLEAAWIEGQASLLAMHLHDGKPCPVCGSLEHPNKAAISSEVPSREALQQIKEQLRIAEQELHEAAAQVAAARSSQSQRADILDEYGIVAHSYADQLQEVIAAGKALAAQTELLQAEARQHEECQKQLQALDQQVDKLLAERERCSLELQQTAVRYGQESARLELELQRIPEQLREAERLERAIANLAGRLQEMTAAWQEAQRRLQAAEQLRMQTAAQLDSLTKQHEEAAARAEEARLRFESQLSRAGFADVERYRQAKMEEAAREALRKQLEEYRQTLSIVSKQVEQLAAQLQDRQPVDLEPLLDAIAAAKQELETIAAAKQSAERYRQDALRIAQAIEQAARRVQELEGELEKVLDLYQVIKGDNPLRLSFERYILIEYLEQILQAANVRLQQLSGGQYLLQRSGRLEARGRQSGLGLDVYDAYTGQNRDVKTLSGGEKFNASLALALGMTDVIQSYQGGVSIEMMFIDEGFGSLDEETLQKAVATLVELQRAGRMIGVISHVPELKEAIPAVLEVTKTREGFSRTSIIIR